MQELNSESLSEVNGGALPLLIAVLTTDSFAMGFTAGALVGYATVKNLFE
ncbi:class IIb bacteriocin, lactobin A/cerein 7B family [Paraferrimonas sedimenticola]|uniref:Uncharacterized protein n=1 Tax=Paraferrimonas sedimenticola TaxID=375674 RepID=A0AA37W291_9GAMM|nr:hypothetical protein GCM10007895_30720 [Paraferrimonas sedimenticola]